MTAKFVYQGFRQEEVVLRSQMQDPLADRPIAYFEGMPSWQQQGYGMAAMTLARQRGFGVGSMLRKLWKYLRPLAMSAKPLAFSAARRLGKEGL